MVTPRTVNDTHRRWWAGPVGIISALALLLAACGGGDGDATAGADDGEVTSLTVLGFGGYEAPAFHPMFLENHPDVELDYQFGDSDGDFLTKVQAGGISPSVVHPCSGWIDLWVEEGAQPLDTSLLTNWDDVDDGLKEAGEVDGEYYWAPWDWGYTSLVVATDRVDEVPTSWKAMWDDEYAGRVSIWDDAEAGVATTAYAWGIDPYSMDDDDLAFVREKLEELHANIQTYWAGGSEINQLLLDGEVDIAKTWTETYAAVLEGDMEAVFIEPEEGRMGWSCGLIVLEEPGTPQYEMAHEYIDAMLDTSSGVNLVNDFYYGHSNVETVDLADESVVELIELDRFDVRDRTNFYNPLTAEERETWQRMWTEVTAG